MKCGTIEIISGDSVYVLDKKFVEMVRGRKGFFWGKKIIDDSTLVSWAIEQNRVVERLDLIGGLI